MAFEVEARLAGHVGTIRWVNGRVEGDPLLVAHVQSLAISLEGHWVGRPMCPGSTHHHLAHPFSVVALFYEAFDQIDAWRGDVPQAPPVPPGAIA